MADADYGLRAEDFRKSWPNAMVVAMREVGGLTDKLDRTREEIVSLALVSPQMLNEAKRLLGESADKMVRQIDRAGAAGRSQIDEATARLVLQQAKFMADFEIERTEMEKKRNAMDALRADILMAQRKLDKETAAFNKMSLWKRVFAKA